MKDQTPIGWVLIDENDIVVGGVVGADPVFLCPIPPDCRLRVCHKPIVMGIRFEASDDVASLSQRLAQVEAERDAREKEVEGLEEYIEDLRLICEQANIDPDAARAALSEAK